MKISELLVPEEMEVEIKNGVMGLPDDEVDDELSSEEEDDHDVPKGDVEKEMKAEDHFITNIDRETVTNRNFRQVLYTSSNMQLVVMSIRPGQDIGEEVHESVDQFIRVERGSGTVVFNGMEHRIRGGSAFIIPQGTEHNIINTGSRSLKLYTVYSPPNHMKDAVHKTRRASRGDKRHFDGDTDTMNGEK